MDGHSFCRTLLRTAVADMKVQDSKFKPGMLSVTKSSLGGYEVMGPDKYYVRAGKFYHYASSACCAWSAKAEAIDKILTKRKDLNQTGKGKQMKEARGKEIITYAINCAADKHGIEECLSLQLMIDNMELDLFYQELTNRMMKEFPEEFGELIHE